MIRQRTGGRTRAGFSMLEVLMVIFIICVVISLILPALVAGRESADRVSCINNLRQLSLALQNYETQLLVLPSGVVNPTGPVHNRPDDLQLHTGWLLQLLPYMEQVGVSKAFVPELSVYAPENTTARTTTMRTLVCPSDRSAARPQPVGVSSYAGCHHDVEAPIDAEQNGVFYRNSSTTHADLLDGSTYTIFVGEKLLDSRDLGWASGTRSTLRNTGNRINADLAALKMKLPPVEGEDPDDLKVGGFGSHHAGGANFMFGDGSVRFLTEKIDPQVFRYLGHRADGEPIDDDGF